LLWSISLLVIPLTTNAQSNYSYEKQDSDTVVLHIDEIRVEQQVLNGYMFDEINKLKKLLNSSEGIKEDETEEPNN